MTAGTDLEPIHITRLLREETAEKMAEVMVRTPLRQAVSMAGEEPQPTDRLGMRLPLWPSVARGSGISLLLELGRKMETPLAQPELATGISSPLSACQGLKARS